MTYDQMQSIIELYLAELEKDGIDPCGFPIHEARELLLDFAQWFTDDVEDSWEDKLQEGFKPGEIIAIQAPLTPTGKSNFAAQLFDPHTALADELFNIEDDEIMLSKAMRKSKLPLIPIPIEEDSDVE